MLRARFWNCRQGNVAPLLGLAMVPLLAAVGVAVDFSRANAARAAFQAALDSTALMVSKTAATSTAAELQANATKYFNALFNRPDTSDVTIQASYSSDGGSKVVISGTAKVATEFMHAVGAILNLSDLDSMTIGASSTAVWGNTRLRVALVLDNTGSMAQDGKMDALKTASQNLLSQLKFVAVNPEDVYVSIVPFSKDVNVGPGNYNQSWLYWDDGVTTADNYWDALNGTCSRGSAFKTRSKCLAYPVCSKSQYTTSSQCISHGGTWYSTAGTWTHASHSTWNGCVTDRNQNFDTTNDPPVAGGTLYPPEQYSSCPSPLIGLTNDWTALSNAINAMQPNGNTNQAIGLQVGWQTLTAAPFTVPPMDPQYTYKQVIILLTDGLNTQDRWYTSQSLIDAREQKTCDNIKAAGLTIYTVQVNTDNEPVSTLLQNCASDPSKFFLLTSSTQIVSTFNQIGTAITDLRLAY